ncbi:MAG: LemA family protein [Alphaproteobacteria bacterium]|nr:LemA family protein [Alphaproteobacteria bacterium]
MKKFLVILVLVVMAAITWGIGVINHTVQLDEDANAKWSQIQNQFQRRSDLIPNLVNTVKGYQTHERQTLIDVVEARAKAHQVQVNLNDEASLKQYMAAQGELSSALSRLMAVAEAYPELKANENFLALQSQLEGTENRIAVARRDYIEAVRAYNTQLRVFPSSFIIRNFTQMKTRAMIEADEKAQVAPVVSFE